MSLIYCAAKLIILRDEVIVIKWRW